MERKAYSKETFHSYSHHLRIRHKEPYHQCAKHLLLDYFEEKNKSVFAKSKII